MAYDVFKLFATDEIKETQGVEISLAKGVSMTVARANNDNFMEMIIAKTDEHMDSLKSLPKKEAAELDLQILCDVLAETVLLGFTGMSYKGKKIKYSKENAVKLLKLKDFRKLVLTHANNLDKYRVEQEDDDIKK